MRDKERSKKKKKKQEFHIDFLLNDVLKIVSKYRKIEEFLPLLPLASETKV